jgi:hypothetical protein
MLCSNLNTMGTMTERSWRPLIAIVAAVLLIAVLFFVIRPGRSASSAAQETTADVTLAVDGRDNANVSMAADGSFVAAVWSAAAASGGAEIFAAASRDGGATFSRPVRVSSPDNNVNVNGEQPPRVTLVPHDNGTPGITVVWTEKGDTGARLAFARSTDGGVSFGSSAAVAGGEAAGNRGWEGITTSPDGRVYAAWLDHRQLAKPQDESVAAHHHHGGEAATTPDDGVAMAQLSQLYVSAIDDPDSVRAVTGGVCYCCKTAIAASGDALFLAWRHVYPGNLRDIAFSASRDGGRTFSAPVRISEDKWQLNGCPDDGPAMALDAAQRIHVVWPTLVEEDGRPVKALFHAVSTDGQTFSVRTRLPTEGQANHPQLSFAGDGRLVAVWDESGSGSRHLAVASTAIDGSGRVAFTRNDAWSSRQATYPFVVRAGERVLFAWTETAPDRSVIRVSEYR